MYCVTIHYMKNKLILMILCVIFMTACTPTDNSSSSTPISGTDFYFDTVITISVYDSEDYSILDSCFDLCSKYESLFSRTIPESDISKINNSKSQVKVSDETIDIINQSIEYSSLTQGKFDITIAPLMDLWGFNTDNSKVPDESGILETLEFVDYKNILINDNFITLTNEHASIDLGGIAKGYIADRLKEHLLSLGVNSALINLGGNIFMVGEKPDGSSFNIGIQKPFADTNESILYIQGKDLSVVSSGIYERNFYENDILYHHILDTDTGYPGTNKLLSVTIISKNSTVGDALSTGCFALGLEKGMALIEDLEQIEAVFIDENYDIYYSSGINLDGNNLTIK